MKLFLASRGSNISTTKKLEEYIGGFSGKNCVYIPTARNGDNVFNTWKDSDTWKFLSSSGMNVFPVQLEDYKENLDFELFENKEVIWFSGGAAGYLMYWIVRTGLNQMLPKILQKAIYVGSSAGSMIASPNLKVCDWYIDENEKGASNIPSLNLVDFDIYPHYEESLYEKIKQNYNGKKLYLLKDGEEIIVEDGKINVIGEERIILND